MERSNYALISALYASKSRGLYSDIYFPIIKYAIVKLYAENTTIDCYATSDEVFEKIKILFGIKIPHVVIAKTVTKLSLVNDSDLELVVFENGNTFQIKNAYFDEEENSYEEKERKFSQNLAEIECEYKMFIKREGTYDDNVTFIDFISANTENILGYFENETEELVEEKYVSMVFFLEYLHKENEELYKVANQLFWSSVLTAFLQSERPRVNDEERGCEAEYYLDTSLILGLLDLSTSENEVSAHDVCDIIKNSGGRLKVHPVTLEEAKSILGSVSLNGAYPGTSIANACTRRNLLATDITQIQLNIQKLVEEKGIQVFPASMSNCRNEVMNKYRGKDVLRQLADIRNRSHDYVYTNDNFREAHDIFMDDYVQKVRKDKSGKDNVYFLTTNTDLIEFCRNRHPERSYMISTSKVILEMWMHNAKPAEVTSCCLTETMARCLDLHRSKVRSKLHDVAKYFNKTRENVAPEVYSEFLRLLYCRAKKIVSFVEQQPEDDPRAYMEKLQNAIKEDKAYYDSVNSNIESRNKSLEDEISSKQQQVESLEKESEQKSREIGGLNAKNEELEGRNKNLSDENDSIAANLRIAQEALNAAKDAVDKELSDKKAAQRLNSLYARKDELTEKLTVLKATMAPLEMSRQKSFNNWLPFTLSLLGCVLIGLFCVFVVLDKSNVHPISSWTPYVTIITIGCALIGFGITTNTDGWKNSRKMKALAKWDELNPSYSDLKKQIEETEEELKFCKHDIKNSTPQE